MKILDAHWTPQINTLQILCESCQTTFEHRTDVWIVHCPKCVTRTNIKQLRNRYLAEKTKLPNVVVLAEFKARKGGRLEAQRRERALQRISKKLD